MPVSRRFYDWSHDNNTPEHADEAIRGLKEAGIRAIYGYGNGNDEWIRRRVERARNALCQRAAVKPDGSWLPRPFNEGADIRTLKTRACEGW